MTSLLKQRLAGGAFLVIPLLLIWLSVAVYNKDFTKTDVVTLHTSSVGNQMQKHAEVKLHGVIVGEVRSISSNGQGATLKLAIDPGKAKLLPSNVTAQMLPTTLFGQRYVDLVPPSQPSPAHLASGSVIEEDRTSSAVELQSILNNLLPLLQDVQPAELSVTLTAISQTVQGRGTQIAQTLETLNSYLKKLNPDLPSLDEDLKQIATLSQTYANAAPDVLQALDDFGTTAKTIHDLQNQLAQIYGTVTTTAQDTTTFLSANGGTFIRLSAASRPTLETLARYSPEFPCTFRMLTDFIPRMDKVLGKGTGHPGLHVDVSTSPSKGRYIPGRDTPSYSDNGGPTCYGQTAATITGNSKPENELINELVAPSTGKTPTALPNWSSVLIGPLYRGSEVTVR